MSYNNAVSYIAVSSLLPALGIFAVGLRFAIRRNQPCGLGIDDWLILPALVSSIGIGIAMIIIVHTYTTQYSGYDFERTQLRGDLVLSVNKTEYGIMIMQVIGLGFAKLSIVYFYRRIFVTVYRRVFNVLTIVLIVFICCWMIAFAVCYGILDHETISSREVADNEVIPETIDLSYLATDVAIDVLLLVIPMPMILRLQMLKTRRFAIMIIFALGALTVVTSILRILSIILVGANIAAGTTFSVNFPSITSFFYWTMIEVGCTVIVACLPTFSIMFRTASIKAMSDNIRRWVYLQSFRKQRSTGKSDKTSEHDPLDHSVQSDILDEPTTPTQAQRQPMASTDLGTQKYSLMEGTNFGS